VRILKPRIKPPILQVALDIIRLDIAIEIAKHAVVGGADWLECGTPLIKSVGMKAVRELKGLFPNIPIVADMKTMDTGELEARIAFSAGSDIISVLGVADDLTIKGAINVAREYDKLVVVDLINHPKPIKRAVEAESMGTDIILVHVGIDQQLRGASPLEYLKEIVRSVECYVAVAGGLNPQTARKAIEAGADIVVVGRYITGSQNITERTQEIKRAIRFRE